MISGKAFEMEWFGYTIDHTERRRREIRSNASHFGIELEAAILLAKQQRKWDGRNPSTPSSKALVTVLQRILTKEGADLENIVEIWPMLGTGVDYRHGADGVVIVRNTILTQGMPLRLDLTRRPKPKREGIYCISPHDSYDLRVCAGREDREMPQPPPPVLEMVNSVLSRMEAVVKSLGTITRQGG